MSRAASKGRSANGDAGVPAESTGGAAVGLTVEILRSIDAFVTFETEWSDLFAKAANPVSYLSHSWLRLCCQPSRNTQNKQLLIIAVREDGHLVMAGAFVLTTREETPIVRFLASGTPQLEDVLWRATARTRDHADLLLATLRAEKGEHRQLRMRRVPEDSVFREAVARAGLNVRPLKSADYFFIPLSDHRDFEAYLAALSANLRHDHRRQMRRLEERGGFAFAIEGAPQVGEALDWMFEQKRAWLAAQNMPMGSFQNRRIDRFVARFIESEGPSKSWVATLRIKGQIIAAGLAFLERDAVNFRVVAHDPAFSVNSPGRCLAMLLVAEAFSRGAPAFTFGTGGMEWKERLLPKRGSVLSERIRL